MQKYGLNKKQRLCSRTAIFKLFEKNDGSHHVLAYPWRAFWRINNERGDDKANKIIITVPKRKIRHATDRVKMRRRCRESYRLQQHLLETNSNIDLGFIYIGDKPTEFDNTFSSINKILKKISSKLIEIGRESDEKI